MMIGKRAGCRSIIKIIFIDAGVSLNKGYTVMHITNVWRTTDRNGG